MTNNQLTENSVTQLLNSVKLARDNAERDDNRVDHSFYYALARALEELQERRKVAMDSEPVLEIESEPVFTLEVARGDYKGQKLGNHFGFITLDAARELKEGKYLLYRHAQQPVVVGDGRAEFETWMLKCWGRERRDDDFAMGKFIYGEDYADSYTRCVWKAWSASRAAMLAAAPQEVK